MADDLCATCRWAEIQPSLFGGKADERCGHPQAQGQEYDPLEQPVGASFQHHLADMRRASWPCGPEAKLRKERHDA